MKTLTQIALVALMVALGIQPSSHASVQTYGFTRITNNASADVSSQLFVDVWDAAGASADLTGFYGAGVPNINISPGAVLFVFRNSAAVASNVAQIYFDDGTLLALNKIWDEDNNTNLRGDVDFSTGASPSNLPGGGSISPAFSATVAFDSSADNPAPANGINGSQDLLGLSFTLQSGKTYADTIAALALGLTDGGNASALRIGLHVTGIAGGTSDSYINTGTVPEPGTMAVWGLLAVTGYFGVKKWQAKA